MRECGSNNENDNRRITQDKQNTALPLAKVAFVFACWFNNFPRTHDDDMTIEIEEAITMTI
jgi:hypothetical protein